MTTRGLLSFLLISFGTLSHGQESSVNSTTKVSRSTIDVASMLITRLVADVLLNASQSLSGSTSVHDQMEAVLLKSAHRLNAMGHLLAKMGAAVKVGGRQLRDADSTLSIVFGPAKFRKQKALLWALDIANLGNCSKEARLTRITAKIVNTYAARTKPSSIYRGAEQIGDIVGSAGDALEDIARRLAASGENGTAELPKNELSESEEQLLHNITEIIVKHKAH
uniref:Putative secreted protein n=1 Tax=Amblyomma triste TaxID=251400 RepID=A0A023G329_AMBTT